jgi:hypothetical protein
LFAAVRDLTLQRPLRSADGRGHIPSGRSALSDFWVARELLAGTKIVAIAMARTKDEARTQFTHTAAWEKRGAHERIYRLFTKGGTVQPLVMIWC